MDPRQPDDAVLQTAQRWALDLPSAGYVQRRQFVRWITGSPEHLRAYLLIKALDTELAGVKRVTEFGLETALQRRPRVVAALPGKVITLPVPSGPSVRGTSPNRALPPPKQNPALAPPRWRIPHWIAVAVSVTVLALVLWTVCYHPANLNTTYMELTTDIGQRRSLILPDRTRLQLNTNSTVLLHYDAGLRNLTLVKGEAWIRVAPDVKRPFEVDVGTLTIKDIGTEFTVRAEPGETTVYVIEGRVLLSTGSERAAGSITMARMGNADTSAWQSTSAVELTQNQEIVVRMNGRRALLPGTLRTLTATESQKRLAWTKGKLVLTGEPLREVVREINRYHRQKLVIADPALEQIEVGGVIDPATYDYRVIRRALGISCPIELDDSNPAVLLLKRSRASGCRASR